MNSGAPGSDFQAASLQDLAPLTAALDDFCRHAGVADEHGFALRLATEEAFANIMQHGYRGAGGPVHIHFEAGEGEIRVVLHDRASPFDPADSPVPQLEADWAAREVGGLGWHLLREMVDEVRYQRGRNDENILTLVRHVRGTASEH